MNAKLISSLLSTSVLTVLFLASACDDPFGACREGLDCPGDGSGPRSGGSSPGGDTSGGNASTGGSESGGVGGGASDGGATPTGGTASGGEGGEPAGGAPPQPCNGSCPEETPVCDEGEEGADDDTCVGCLEHADCEGDPTTPMCSLDQECVPCLDDFTCINTLELPDTPACLDGTEDPMTGEQRPSTGECVECGISKDCGGAICDPDTHECIEGTSYKGKGLCDECIDDRECKDGQLCIEMTFDDPAEGVVGSFCLWRKDADGLAAPKGTCGLNSRPYATTIVKAVSANGVEADVCSPRTTTCPAIKQHATSVAGCEAEGDDEACGAEGFNDGKCRLDGNSDPMCTYACSGTDPRDCPEGISCTDTGTEKYCAL